MQKKNYEKEVFFSATHTTSPYWVRFKTPEQQFLDRSTYYLGI